MSTDSTANIPPKDDYYYPIITQLAQSTDPLQFLTTITQINANPTIFIRLTKLKYWTQVLSSIQEQLQETSAVFSLNTDPKDIAVYTMPPISYWSSWTRSSCTPEHSSISLLHLW